MEGDIKRKQSCRICGGTDFFKDAGYFYCETCQTQNEDVREEVLEMRIDATTRLRKVMIKKPKVNRHGEELGWTTWELYNFVLIGLTDQLIELGASSCVKLTVLQLWATYLGKIEVAFTSTKKKHVPKLSRGYNKKDAEIIYGKVRTQKKIRGQSRSWNSTNTSVASGYHSDGSSSKIFHRSKKLMIKADYDRYLQSQPSSINDGLSIFSQSGYSSCSDGGRSSEGEEKIHFNKQAKQERKKIKELSKKVPTLERDKYEETHITTQYRTGPQVITAMKLWAIIYLALRIHDEPIHLGDMLRYAREGHMSYFRLDHLLPPEIKPSQKDVNFLSQNTEITHKGMRRIAANMAKYIGIEKIYCPNFLPLISRYCQELALPRGILLYAERLIALSPPTMTFDAKKSYVPNYEARAMAYIIVVLKVLFGLDGVTERVISNTVERVNALAHKQGVFDQKLFNFCEWQRYIECRKNVLANMHFPTKLKCNPNVPLKSHTYSKFLEYIQLKRDGEEPEITDYKHLLPRDLADAMKQAIDNLNRNNVPPEEVQVFAPSLTPFHSYLQQILDDTANKLPDILKTDFYFTKVGYMTNIQTFKELAVQCNIDLEITDSSSHFIDKIVPYFEPSKIANLSEFQRDVLVCDNSEKKDKNVKTIDNFITYMDKKAPCYIRINDTKLLHFDNIQSSLRTTSRLKLNDQNDFVFRDVLPSGKLLILEESESESESESEDNILNHKNSSENRNSLTRADAYKKYNVTLTNFEEESIDKPHKLETIESFMKRRMHRFRDSKGKFMKAAQDEKLKHIYSSVKSKIANEFNIDELHNFTGLNFDISTEMDILQEACNIFPLQDQEQLLNDKEYNSDYSLPNLDDCFDLSDISILCEDNWINKLNIESEAFSLNNIDDFSEENSNSMRFYRPFKDYWMYHCIFSRVKGKNFELFEKVLPRSFRWLLNECANILEMTMEDLYEEVCIVESFHSQILNSDNLYENTQHHSTEFFSRLHRSLIISKW